LKSAVAGSPLRDYRDEGAAFTLDLVGQPWSSPTRQPWRVPGKT